MKGLITMRSTAVALIIVAALLALSCGGSETGFHRSDKGPADLRVSAIPSVIDTGEQIEVRVHVSDIAAGGIMLKLRVPLGLRWVDNSTFLQAGSRIYEFAPQTVESDTGHTYLVFFFTPFSFNGAIAGELVNTFFGQQEVSSGFVEVDADPDDPEVEDWEEFDIAAPLFTAQDRASIQVRGENHGNTSSGGSTSSQGS